MPTKQQTTSSATQTQQQAGSSQGGFQNIYDPASMSRYQQAQGQALGGLQSWAQNPLQNSFFNTLAQMSRQNVGQQGQSNMQSFLQNLRTSGMSGSSPFAQAQTAQMGRFNSGQQAQGFNALLSQMPQYQMQALSGLMGGFNPLQTGGSQNQSYKGNMSGTQNSNQTQQTTGLGTWLGPLLQGVMGGASNLMGAGKYSGPGAGSMGASTSANPLMGPTSGMQFPTMGNMNSLMGSSPGNSFMPFSPGNFNPGGG